MFFVAGCSGENGIDRRSWMKDIPDETAVCMMSIPGAHDACTANVDEEYSYFRTQVLDIQGLWDAGVRSFDVRPTSRGNHLGVFHQMADTHVSFEDVVNTLASCLDKHPSEFAVIVFRHESDADLADNFSSLMGQYLNSCLPKGLAIPFREGLTLGEMRGHILFLSRDHYDGGLVGGFIQGWPDQALIVNEKGVGVPLYVQDHYDPIGKADKLEQIVNTYKEYASSTTWTINHTSAYVESGYGENSQNVNSDTADLIRSGKGKTGIMVLDFAGVDTFEGYEVSGKKLVDSIIDNNFI